MKHKGTQIGLGRNDRKIRKSFFVSISQVIYDEDDKSKNCKDYPNEHYESYGHCDSDFTKNEYMAAFETEDCLVGNKDVTPIFATKNLDKVSYLNITNCTSSMYHLRGLFIGTIASLCPTPCNETLTTSALISSGKSDSGVLIDKITVDRVQLMESLNYILMIF